MATGRTATKFTRVYVDGYDLSGSARSLGPLNWEYETSPDAALADAVKGALPGQAVLGVDKINAFLETNATVTAMHDIFKTGAGGYRTLMAPIGIRAVPAMGDPVYCLSAPQASYQAEIASTGGFTYASMSLDTVSSTAPGISYARPWGVLLHAKGAEVGANASAGVDDTPGLVSTLFGGYLVYQIFASNAAGTATIKVQDAAINANANFADLAGATTAAIAFGSIPCAGVIALTTTATVRQFLRWQLTLAGGMNTCTFALAFVRARGLGF